MTTEQEMFDDACDDRPRHCPECGERAAVAMPAEEDVGIMSDLLSCKEHGEFYFDDTGKAIFVDAPKPGK